MSRLRTRLETALGAVLASADEVACCGCVACFEDDVLVVDAADCSHSGRLESNPACRDVAVGALVERDAETVRIETEGIERVYEDDAAALLTAAGRFVEQCRFHDERLARMARSDPLGACREATGRADVVADIAAETGLAALAERAESYETVLAPYVGPTVSRWRVDVTPPANARLATVRELDTGATVRRYTRPDEPPRYQLIPLEAQLSDSALTVLADAYRRLGNGEFAGGDRAPARAVRAVVEGVDHDIESPEGNNQVDAPVQTVARVLRKHTRGYGLLEDLFGDAALSDAFVTAPPASNPLRVRVDGDTLETNIRLTASGVAALSSRFRRVSGRAFSRADPTLDATSTIADRRVRVAGVTEPTSPETAFAFRAHDRTVWTLPALIANGTMTTEAAALLSVAVERGRSLLLAGPRGAGKTTLLGALLWELPPTVRTVLIEDTPELPVGPLQDAGRDVQSLVAGADGEELSPAAALRTALRLGDGALAVGEVRGEEAAVLYEAMRVGANSEAVLGTIHGDSAASVYERVVTDLGVSASSFGATDLVVSLEIESGGTRRLRAIEEVRRSEDGPVFDALFDRADGGLTATGRIDRGNSTLVAALARPDESYKTVRQALAKRERLLSDLADRSESGADPVTARDGSR